MLERRDGYAWAPESSPNQGEAHLAQVTVIPVQEDSVRLGTLTSGEADVIRYVQPSEEQGLADAGYEIVSKTGVGLSNQWFLRPGAPHFDDIQVRRALLHAIDREQIIETQYTESWTAASSVLSPDTCLLYTSPSPRD